MALSTDNTWRDIATKGLDNLLPSARIVKSAAVLYDGAFCTHDTTTGEIKPFDGTATDKAVGWYFGASVTGNASAPRVTAGIVSGGFQARVPVTGLHGSVLATDDGKPVYMTDDGTYTLTDPGTGMRVGEVVGNDGGVTIGTNAWVALRNMRGLVGGE